MRFAPSNFRRGDLLAAAGALVLLVLLFALKWYGPGVINSGDVATTPVNGWHALIHLRWLMLVTILAALLLPFAGIAVGSRTLRLASSAAFGLLALATVLWLGYRVLISIPPGEKPGAYIGWACALVILLGAAVSLVSSWNQRPTESAAASRSASSPRGA